MRLSALDSPMQQLLVLLIQATFKQLIRHMSFLGRYSIPTLHAYTSLLNHAYILPSQLQPANTEVEAMDNHSENWLIFFPEWTVVQWLIDHPEFLSNPVYVGGDSYSGITVPLVVQHISNGKSPACWCIYI